MFIICDNKEHMCIVTITKNKTNAILVRNCLEYKEMEFYDLPEVRRGRFVIMEKSDAIDEDTSTVKTFSLFDFENKLLTHEMNMTKDFKFWESKIPRKVFENAMILMKYHKAIL